MYKAIIQLTLILLFFTASPGYTQNWMCAQDLNSDGAADDPGETATCNSTPQGYLCPLGAANCEKTYLDPVCPEGSYYDSRCKRCIKKGCQSSIAFCIVCSAGSPRCPAGTVRVINKCVKTTCPLGDYPCMDNQGVLQCSPNQCIDLATNPPTNNDTEMDLPEDDGNTDASGVCLDQIRIFQGGGMRCRGTGTQTAFHNCCNNETGMIVKDSSGAKKPTGAIMEALNYIQGLFTHGNCDEQDMTTAILNDSGFCHEIGTHCIEEWDLGFDEVCVQKATVFCCFNSKLGRIIHEQGRIQLKSFQPDGAWGTTESPNCRGFTPEEFQMIDFSKIDFSEYFDDLQHKVAGEVQQDIGEKIQEFYEQTQNP